jgi:DNA invertase Pin-like site-specific DNA recombinase
MRRAIGIVRVSQRQDDSGHSPEVQVRAMLKQAEDADFTLTLADIWDENVDGNGTVRPASGGATLADRPKLRAAVEAIERGGASVIVAERFDRLFRDLDVQREVIRRVEAAGGRLVTAAGKISHATAEAELHANLNGSIAQYTKRTAMERSRDAVIIAIRDGVVPWPKVTPGYLCGEDGRFYPDPKRRGAVAKAFEMRAGGATVKQIVAFLRAKGIDISYNGVVGLLRSRVVLGEIHFGHYEPNLAAHEPIVSAEVWRAVQRVRVPRGRQAKSDRVLARAGVLRCGSCGHAMIAGSRVQSGRSYPYYRCCFVDCPARMVISSQIVEPLVVDAVRAALRDAEGRASAQHNARDAEIALERAQAELDALIAILDPLEPAARQRLATATETRDQAREHAERLGGNRAAVTVNASTDWDRLSLDGRRALIRAVVDRVEIGPGRGGERVTVQLVGE